MFVMLNRIKTQLHWNTVGRLRRAWNERRVQRSRQTKFERVLENVNRVDSTDAPRALICFDSEPFEDPEVYERNFFHAHQWQGPEMARLLGGYGLRVDVTSWQNRRPPAPDDYDVIFGIGPAFANLARRNRSHAVLVYLATGTYAGQTRAAESDQTQLLSREFGKRVKPRLIPCDFGPNYSDALLVQGNAWVEETYRAVTQSPAFRFGNIVIDGIDPPDDDKDYASARKKFLWMSAYGAVRRRLHVLLEAFREMPDCHLHICGGVKHERDFYSAYETELTKCPNIHLEGWVKLQSEHFKDLARRCGYLIYPSTSDGDPGSVVNTMAAGLFPLITREAGIDLKDHCEIIEQPTVSEIRRLVKAVSSRESADLKHDAVAASRFAFSTFTKDAFRSFFQEFVETFLLNGINMKRGRTS